MSATAAMQELNSSGSAQQTMAQFGSEPADDNIDDILGVPEIYELEQRYEVASEGEAAQ